MPIKAKKIIVLVAVVMVIVSSLSVTAFASVSQFNFTPDMFTAFLEGYDSWMIFKQGVRYDIVYFNEADVASFTVSDVNTGMYKIDFGGLSLQVATFDDSTDCFSYAVYSGSSDCSSLVLMTAGWKSASITKAGIFLTNSPSLEALVKSAGYVVDYNFYMYFGNVDRKEYIICAVTVADSDVPLVVLAPYDPSYDSQTKELSCADDMYLFWCNSVESCLEFLKTSQSVGNISTIEASKTVSNIVDFKYSSCNIIDVYSGNIVFYGRGLDDYNDSGLGSGDLDTIPDLDFDNINLNNFWSQLKDLWAQLKEIAVQVLNFFSSLPDWFSWLPIDFQSALVVLASTISVLFVVLLVLKVLHG